MKIGIIGSGVVGTTLAKAVLRSGNEVILCNSRSPETLKDLITELGPGAYAGTKEETASQEIVILAVWWDSIRNVLTGLPNWNGRILIDATNQLHVTCKGIEPVRTEPLTGSEVVASLACGANVIKAFNSLYADFMDGASSLGRRVLFYAGDDDAAKQTAADLFTDMQFYPVDVGRLSSGGRLMQAGGVLSGTHFIQPEEGNIHFNHNM